MATFTMPLQDDLKACIKDLGNAEDIINLSRVDLCADFLTSNPLEAIREIQFVTRAKIIDRHSDSRQFSGFSIGNGGKISARLYNKTLEMLKKPRPYLEDLWRKQGWNGTDTVWRLEFQLRRPVLKEFGVERFNDLEQGLAGLWGYSSSKWLRLAIPSETDKTQSRWPTASVWQTLQNAQFSGNQDLSRVDIEKTRQPSEKTLFENGLSALTSFMALNGHSLYQDGFKAYIKAARAYHERRSIYTKLDLQGYVTEKIRVKQRRFNTAVNVPPHQDQDQHPADAAVANAHQKAVNAYRKAKDGE